jgi:hypothetical protein
VDPLPSSSQDPSSFQSSMLPVVLTKRLHASSRPDIPKGITLHLERQQSKISWIKELEQRIANKKKQLRNRSLN